MFTVKLLFREMFRRVSSQLATSPVTCWTIQGKMAKSFDTGLAIIIFIIACSFIILIYLLLFIEHKHCPILFKNNTVSSVTGKCIMTILTLIHRKIITASNTAAVIKFLSHPQDQVWANTKTHPWIPSLSRKSVVPSPKFWNKAVSQITWTWATTNP